MARHRRRRHFRDPVISMPSFGSLRDWNPLNRTVNSTDVLVGAGIGLAGGGLVMYGLRTYWPTAPIPAQYVGLVSSVVAGGAAYSLMKRKSPGRAAGYFAGAVAMGVVPVVWAMIKSALPASASSYFGDPVIAMPSFGGLLTRSPGPLAGLLTSSPGPALAYPSSARRAMGY